jgi:glycosyltransferase involved in cell wall biosynthesis
VNLDVVIVAYESADHLPNCVDALPEGARVIVVDNASTDGSADVAEALGCSVIRNEANHGFGRAVNRAMREAVSSDFVLLINPDARIESASLKQLLDAAAQPDVAVAGPKLRGRDGRLQRPWWDFPSTSQAWGEAVGLHRVHGVSFDKSRDVDFVVGACFLLRAEAFRAVGGFDERFWLYGEEADLCKRLQQGGWRVRYVSDAVADHIGGASGEGTRELVAEHFARGSDRFVLTHQGPRALVSYRLANLVGSAVRSLLHRRSTPQRAVRVRIMRRVAHALVHYPTQVASGAGVGRCIVAASLESWDDVWRRNQFLIRELTDADPSLRVLFVEPALDPLHALVTKHRWPRVGGLGALRTVAGRPQVMRFRPIKWLPRRLGRWADRSIVRQIIRAASRAEMNAPTLWVNDPDLAPLTAKCPWPVLYDVTDDWLRASNGGRAQAMRANREAHLLAVAGSVVVCSPHLERTKGERRPVHLIPNAVDVDRFRTDAERPRDLPPRPVAIYVGTLHEDRLDVGLVEAVARDLPNVALAFVGPDCLSHRSRARLNALPNVHLLGARSYDDVPAYYGHADVVIVPHVVSPFTESLDPIKAYECLAMGRATLATPVAGFRELGEPVSIAGRDHFARCLAGLLSSAPTGATQAHLPSWADRARDFEGALAAAARGLGAPKVPLRVVYVDHTARLSGGELALSRVLPSLMDVGIEPHVILGEEGDLVDALRSKGVTVEVLPFGRSARDLRRDRVRLLALPLGSIVETVAYAWRLSRRIRALQPDLVHTNSLKAAVYGGLAGRMAGVPTLWHVRDRIAPDYLPRPAVAMVRTMARVLPSAVIANSRATLATLGELKGPMAVSPSPVVMDAVEVIEARRRRSCRPLSVGMLGRISPWKGQHVFLEAFALAFPCGDERALVVGCPMFGEDDYFESIQELACTLGIEERVNFTGHRTDTEQVLGEVDVLVHASTVPEPFGQVVIEGMAAGLPVIASGAGGPLEIITNWADGVLTAPGDARALAAALTALAADPTLRRNLGRQARRRAEAFRPADIAAQMASVYARMGGAV